MPVPVPIIVNPMEAFQYPCPGGGDRLYVALAKIQQLYMIIALEIPSASVKIFTIGDTCEIVRQVPPDWAGPPDELILKGPPCGKHSPGAPHFMNIGKEGPPPCGGAAGAEPPSNFVPIDPSLWNVWEVLEFQDGECVVVAWRVRGYHEVMSADPGTVRGTEGILANSLNTFAPIGDETPSTALVRKIFEVGGDDGYNFEDWEVDKYIDPNEAPPHGHVIVSFFVDNMPIANSAPPTKPPGEQWNIDNRIPPEGTLEPVAGGALDSMVLGVFPIPQDVVLEEIKTPFQEMDDTGQYAMDDDGNVLQPPTLVGTKLYQELVDQYNIDNSRWQEFNGPGYFEIHVEPPPEPPGPGDPPVVLNCGILAFGPDPEEE